MKDLFCQSKQVTVVVTNPPTYISLFPLKPPFLHAYFYVAGKKCMAEKKQSRYERSLYVIAQRMKKVASIKFKDNISLRVVL